MTDCGVPLRPTDAVTPVPLLTTVPLIRPEQARAFASVWVRAVAARDGLAIPAEASDAEVDNERQLMSDSDAWGSVAAMAGRAVGIYLVTQARTDRGAGAAVEGTAHLLRVAVDPDWWGQRIGERLLAAAAESAAARGYEMLELSVQVDNARAVSLYERSGWVDTGDRYEKPATGVVMARFERPLLAPP